MARLSAENYINSSPATPHNVRKSSRFKDLFRGPNSRASLSPRPNTADPAETSPLGAENAKPDFQKVGLLPSERTEKVKKRIESKKRESPSKSLENHADELEDFGVPHVLGTGLKGSGVRFGDGDDVDEKHTPETQEMRESSTQHLIDFLKYEDHMQRKIGENNAKGTAKTVREIGEIDTETEAKAGPASDKPAISIAEPIELKDLNNTQVFVEQVPDMNTELERRTYQGTSWLFDVENSNNLEGQPTIAEDATSKHCDDAKDRTAVAKETVVDGTSADHVADLVAHPEEPQIEIVEPTTDEVLDSSTARIAGITVPKQLETLVYEIFHQIDKIQSFISTSTVKAAAPTLMPDYASTFHRILAVLLGVVLLLLALSGPQRLFVNMWRVTVLLCIYAVVRKQLGVVGKDPVLGPLEDGLHSLCGWAAAEYSAALEELAAQILRKIREQAQAEDELESVGECL